MSPAKSSIDLDSRSSFAMAAAGVPMRTLQEWMGHKDFATTLIYADYAPSANEAGLVDAAFGSATVHAPSLQWDRVMSPLAS